MFYAGDTQNGMALAARESKAVACLIDDDNEESATWRDEYLAGEEISRLLVAKAVLLRLKLGCPEARFLHGFCIIGTAPAFVIIRNGKTAEVIDAGTPAHELKRRVIACLDGGSVRNRETPESGGTRATEADRAALASTPVTNARAADKQQEALKNGLPSAEGRQVVCQDITGGQVPSPSPPPIKPPIYRMRVRLFDGSTLHNAFQPTSTIRTAVRPWLDATRTDGRKPYRLRLILTPEPSRMMRDEDEDTPFAALGVEKTASCVMVPHRGPPEPVPKPVPETRSGLEPGKPSADAAGSLKEYMVSWMWLIASIPMRFFVYGMRIAYGLLVRGVNAAAAILGSVLGIGRVPPGVISSSGQLREAASDDAGTTRYLGRKNHSHGTRHRGSNVRTLRDTEPDVNDVSRPFYNGNSTNFSPRDRGDND